MRVHTVDCPPEVKGISQHRHRGVLVNNCADGSDNEDDDSVGKSLGVSGQQVSDDASDEETDEHEQENDLRVLQRRGGAGPQTPVHGDEADDDECSICLAGAGYRLLWLVIKRKWDPLPSIYSKTIEEDDGQMTAVSVRRPSSSCREARRQRVAGRELKLTIEAELFLNKVLLR